MGTTCCHGRSRPAPLALPTVREKKPAPRRKTAQTPRLSIRTVSRSPLESPSPREPRSAVTPSRVRLSSSSEELTPGRVLTLLHFESEGEEAPEMEKELERRVWTLGRLEDLTKAVRGNIEAVLKGLRGKKVAYEDEVVIGVEECTGNQFFHDSQLLLLVLTSHHLLWLEAPSGLSLLHSVETADLKALLLPASKDSAALYHPTHTAWIKAKRLGEILTAVENTFLGLRGHCLPYVVLEHMLQVQDTVDSFPEELLGALYSYEHLQVQGAIVTHGRVGEKVIVVRESMLISLSTRAESISVLTDEALYSLYRDFTLQMRINLTEITAILASKREEAVGVQTASQRLYWKLPLTFCEILEKQVRSRTGRNLRASYSKTIEITA